MQFQVPLTALNISTICTRSKARIHILYRYLYINSLNAATKYIVLYRHHGCQPARRGEPENQLDN